MKPTQRDKSLGSRNRRSTTPFLQLSASSLRSNSGKIQRARSTPGFILSETNRRAVWEEAVKTSTILASEPDVQRISVPPLTPENCLTPISLGVSSLGSNVSVASLSPSGFLALPNPGREPNLLFLDESSTAEFDAVSDYPMPEHYSRYGYSDYTSGYQSHYASQAGQVAHSSGYPPAVTHSSSGDAPTSGLLSPTSGTYPYQAISSPSYSSSYSTSSVATTLAPQTAPYSMTTPNPIYRGSSSDGVHSGQYPYPNYESQASSTSGEIGSGYSYAARPSQLLQYPYASTSGTSTYEASAYTSAAWPPGYQTAGYAPGTTSHSAYPAQYVSTSGQALMHSGGVPSPHNQAKEPPRCWDHGCNGRTFSTFSNLLRHQREKSGTATRAECPRCGASFTRTTARNGHMAHDKCKRKTPSETPEDD